MTASKPLKVLVSGREAAVLRSIEAMLAGQPGLSAAVRVLAPGQAPLAALPPGTSVLVYCCDDAHLEDLRAIAAEPVADRPPLVICGPLRSAEAARLVVRCGAADLLPTLPGIAELVEAVHHAAKESDAGPASSRVPGEVTTVIGAAGGVGSSFIASNLAQLSVQRGERSAVLVDLDLQYAPLTAHLGVTPEFGLGEALARADTLDPVALQGYVARHRSGLALMAGSMTGATEMHPASAEQFRTLLQLLAGQFERVVVDASRSLDPLSTVAVLDARHVVLVLEQSIGNVHNASRLHGLLVRQLGVPRDRILTVLNRYSRRAPVGVADIERAVGCGEVHLVGSEYELARESLDTATPLVERDRRSALSRALGDLDARMSGASASAQGGFLRRALPLFRKGEA